MAKFGWLLPAALAHRLQYSGLSISILLLPPPLECGGISIILVGNLVWLSSYPLPSPALSWLQGLNTGRGGGAIIGNYCRHDIFGEKVHPTTGWPFGNKGALTKIWKFTGWCATALATYCPNRSISNLCQPNPGRSDSWGSILFSSTYRSTRVFSHCVLAEMPR